MQVASRKAGAQGQNAGKPRLASRVGKSRGANGKPAPVKGRAARGPKPSGIAHETDALILAIGAKLRAVRQAKQMTLHDLAQRTGLSSSMLSLLERGKTAPSIGTLVAIGSALGVPTAEVLAGPPAPGLAPSISRRADQPVHATPDGVQRRILRSDPGHGIEIAMVEFGPGTASAPHPTTHGGYEFGIGMDGVLEVMVRDEVFTLKEGDLVSYRSTDPHRIANRGKRAARALWVNLRQG